MGLALPSSSNGNSEDDLATGAAAVAEVLAAALATDDFNVEVSVRGIFTGLPSDDGRFPLPPTRTTRRRVGGVRGEVSPS